jgi:hypothetical protein
MVTQMKTTVEIADPVLEKAKRLAETRKTTLKAIIDEALRDFLASRPVQPKFKLRDASFKGGGQGLAPEFANASWEQILDEVYREETDRAAAHL